MPQVDPFGIASILSQILLGIGLVVGVVVLRIYLFWRGLARRRAEIDRHNDAGTIGPTAMFQGATLPWHYDKLAQLGTGGPAEVSIGQRVLRPSIGVKLVVLGLCAMMVYVANQMAGEEMNGFQIADPGQYGWAVIILCLLAAVNGVIYIFTFETRYDRDLLIVTRMMFFRREYLWKDLWRIADDGRYELQLHFEPGGKAKVLKHSIGIEEFKHFALDQIRRNRMADA